MFYLLDGDNPMSYSVREKNRWKIVIVITLFSITISLFLTYLLLYITNGPMMPIIFSIAAIVPAIIAPSQHGRSAAQLSKYKN